MMVYQMGEVKSRFNITFSSEEHRVWASRLLRQRWNSEYVVSRGRLHKADELPGFIAFDDGKPVGLLTYNIEGEEIEVVTLDSIKKGGGVGSSLIEAVVKLGRDKNCRRIWLITTNDNFRALRFYQKWGFTIRALHSNALAKSRELKPEIPLIGLEGIPLRDEIELEILLRV